MKQKKFFKWNKNWESFKHFISVGGIPLQICAMKLGFESLFKKGNISLIKFFFLNYITSVCLYLPYFVPINLFKKFYDSSTHLYQYQSASCYLFQSV